MPDQEIIDKVNSVLKDIGNFFDQANIIPESYKRMAERTGTTDEFFYRNLWLNDKNHKYKPNQNMFSFNANEIEKYRIPSYVVGCSGRANLFAKYAQEGKNAISPTDIRIIPCIQISSIGTKPMHGHQIIAIKMSNGWQLINENKRDITNAKIDIGNTNIQDINSIIGQDIDALNHGKPGNINNISFVIGCCSWSARTIQAPFLRSFYPLGIRITSYTLAIRMDINITSFT